MTPIVFRAERLLTPEPVERGWVSVLGERIIDVGSGPPPGGDVVDLGDRLLVPGFVDLHSHGGGGAAYSDGAEAARTVLATHRASGTTSAIASLVTDAIPVLERQVRALAPLVRSGELLGIHLEGPWLSGLHCGAHHPDHLRDLTPQDLDTLLAAGEGTIPMVRLAVERAGGPVAVSRLVAAGVIGRIEPGAYADLVVLGTDLAVEAVYRHGRQVR